ncbi:DNA replication terminus site-binding protein [Erwinia sp. CPCC 100877]|nr:DNA replication terminus site-binding protein [Erwinia sp. CPCC 100877]
MSRYELTERLTATFRQLEHGLAELRQQFAPCRLMAGRVFELPAVEKGAEHEPVHQITVTQLTGQRAQEAAWRHFTRLFIQQQSERHSSKAAIRLPGALCYSVTPAQHIALRESIERVNALKEELEQIITRESGLPVARRFEWVHQHLPGLITLNAYRRLTAVEGAATLRFGWANKQIVKNLTRNQVLEMLEKSLRAGRTVAPWNREQWAKLVTQEYNDVAALPEQARLKIRRPVKVQPVARVWYADRQRQVQYACPSPLLVLCPEDSMVPDIGELLNYDADNIQHRHRPQAQPLELVIPRLHLWLEK